MQVVPTAALAPAPSADLSACCRLDNYVGSGLHLSPSGIDFDQRIVTLGQVLVPLLCLEPPTLKPPNIFSEQCADCWDCVSQSIA